MKPDKIVAIAKKRGLSGIAITDHGTIRGALEAAILTDDKFQVIIGAEIAAKEGEIIGLFLKEEIRSKIMLDAIEEIHAQGGIAIVPHPFKRNKKWDTELLSKVDAVEIFNARGEPTKFSYKNSLAGNLAEKHNKTITGGSDAHFYFEIGRGLTIFNEALSLNEVKLALIEGRTTVKGKLSSPFVEMGSQFIKAYKQHSLKAFIKTLIKTGILVLSNRNLQR